MFFLQALSRPRNLPFLPPFMYSLRKCIKDIQYAGSFAKLKPWKDFFLINLYLSTNPTDVCRVNDEQPKVSNFENTEKIKIYIHECRSCIHTLASFSIKMSLYPLHVRFWTGCQNTKTEKKNMVPAFCSFIYSLIYSVNIFKYLLCAGIGLGASDTTLIKRDMNPDFMKFISQYGKEKRKQTKPSSQIKQSQIIRRAIYETTMDKYGQDTYLRRFSGRQKSNLIIVIQYLLRCLSTYRYITPSFIPNKFWRSNEVF